jgi:hypothetical protein
MIASGEVDALWILTPILEDEAGIYGYTEEKQYFTETFRKGETPFESIALRPCDDRPRASFRHAQADSRPRIALPDRPAPCDPADAPR